MFAAGLFLTAKPRKPAKCPTGVRVSEQVPTPVKVDGLSDQLRSRQYLGI